MPALMQSLGSIYTQFFPPQPTFTDHELLRCLMGRVFIMTGANSGLGLELVKQLYPTGARIYLACRSRERAEHTIQQVISSADPGSSGNSICESTSLRFLYLDLLDLTTIAPAVAAFAAQESRLDILWNNAGIGGSPVGTTTAQGLEGHVGVNCVGPLILTQSLAPLLRAASRNAPPHSVRVIWTASLSIETHAPAGGIDEGWLAARGGTTQQPGIDYAQSKVGNWWLAVEAARRYASDGIVSVAQNPGQLDTDVWRYQPWWLMMLLRPTLHPQRMGAYTMLYAAFADGLTAGENSGAYVMPWGRIRAWHECPRKDIVRAMEAGGAERFWQWCEEKATSYL